MAEKIIRSRAHGYDAASLVRTARSVTLIWARSRMTQEEQIGLKRDEMDCSALVLMLFGKQRHFILALRPSLGRQKQMKLFMND